MERKQIVALGVLVVLLVGLPYLMGAVKRWYQSDYINPVPPPGATYVGAELPVAPVQAPLTYELKVTSPRTSDVYSLSRPDNIQIKWEYPSHLLGRSLEQQVAIVSHTSGVEVIDIKSPMFERYTTLSPGDHGFVLYALPSEIPPGNYWIRVFLLDRTTGSSYTSYSEPFVVAE